MKKRLKKILMAIVVLLLALSGAFLIYASVFYKADPVALAVMENAGNLRIEDDLILLSPDTAADTALIFYPGAKVEYLAYLPLLEKITERSDITCTLVKMPFNMAIFDVNAADRIIERYPEIENWYIGGHSMGGAMASRFASKQPDKVKGLILLGAYLYGDYPAEKSLTVYGSFNTSVAEQVDYTDNVVVIEGGNHAQFGNYGRQKGDPDATVSSETQQKSAVEAVAGFLAKNTK